MGLLVTEWAATHDGHPITVRRDELTRGFTVYHREREVAKKKWSLVGTGEVEGTIREGERELPIRVKVSFPSKCQIWIDGQRLDVTKRQAAR